MLQAMVNDLKMSMDCSKCFVDLHHEQVHKKFNQGVTFKSQRIKHIISTKVMNALLFFTTVYLYEQGS